MIEAVVGLLMFVNGEIKEARLQDSMAMCLRGKREAERTFSFTLLFVSAMLKFLMLPCIQSHFLEASL